MSGSTNGRLTETAHRYGQGSREIHEDLRRGVSVGAV
jgi:hypothetical protein